MKGGITVFAIRLKELREQAGFSQAVLARKLGVRQSTVGIWENGKNKPQNSKLEMMASIFNVRSLNFSYEAVCPKVSSPRYL